MRTVLLIMSLCLLATQALAVPSTMSFQGVLTDALLRPVADGDHRVEFALYDDPTAGNLVWGEAFEVTTANGVFDAVLGELTPLQLPFNRQYWLGFTVVGDPEMLPRIRLTSVPYAFRTGGVDDDAVGPAAIANGTVVRSINGLTDTVSLVAGNNVTITPSGNALTIDATGGGSGADSDWQVSGNDMYAIPTGKVAIGTTATGLGAKLTVEETFGLTVVEFRDAIASQLTMRGGAGTGSWAMTPTLSQFSSNVDLRLSAGGEAELSGDVVELRSNGVRRMQVENTGETTFYHSNGTAAVEIDGETVEGGGVVRAMDAGGVTRAALFGAFAGGTRGGKLELYSDADSNFPTAVLDAESTNSTGASLHLSNIHGDLTFQALADLGTGDRSVVRMFKPNGTKTVEIDSQEDGSATQGSTIKLYNDSGVATIELDADHGGTNDGRVITSVLEITGGSDLSEQFNVSGAGVEAGMVVSIDPASPGELTLSRRAYDRRVAGVISGAGGVRPGMLMGQRGTEADGEHPVALTGRVYCRVDASFGAIEPGDLLTTSATLGHAMKVTDPSKAHGAILGKAMTALAAGRGMVLVLVSLQ